MRAQTPGGSKRLQNRQHRFDVAARRAELLGDRVEIAGEVAGLVDHIDEIAADHALGRIGDRQRHLFGQMIGERGLRGDEGFEIVA